MGLTKASLRYFRSPGFRFTKSLIDLLIDSGFVFFDLAPPGVPFYASMLQRGKNKMWVLKNTWWADWDTLGNRSPTAGLFSILAQGHLAVIGGHPEAIFRGNNYAERAVSYQRFKDVILAMKNSCPSLGFVFPDEYADNAEAIYKLRIESAERQGANVLFRFRGFSREGNTIVYKGTCDGVSLNGAPIAYQVIKGVTYAVLPSDSSGVGMVVFKNAVNNQIVILQPSRNQAIKRDLTGSPGAVAVYTLRGQRVCAIQNATQREAIDKVRHGFPLLRSGVYMVTSMTPKGKRHTTLFVLP
jgi:hypothetical protein